MAIRERKGRASPWQVYWRNPFTQKQECLNFETKEEALKEDSLIKHRLKFERESFRPQEEQEGEKTLEMTLEQAYFLYLKEKNFSKKSLLWQLDSMRMVLSLLGNLPISSIGRNEIMKVIAQLNLLPIKQITRHNRLSVFRTLLNWCAEKNYRAPIQFPKIAKGHYEKFIPPSVDEINQMLQSARGHILRIIILGSQTGIRIGCSELFKLTWEDIDLERGLIRVHAAHKNPSAPWREIPIKKSLLEILRQWREQDLPQGIIYIIHFKGRQVKSIKSAWASMLRRAGIMRRIRPYDLRHAFATELIARGIDIGTVAKLMGHSSPNMIYQHYQFVLDQQKEAAIEALPEINCMSATVCPNKKRLTDNQ